MSNPMHTVKHSVIIHIKDPRPNKKGAQDVWAAMMLKGVRMMNQGVMAGALVFS